VEAIEHPSPLVALVNLLFAPLGIHVPDHLVFIGLITLFILFIGLAIRASLSVEHPGKLQIVLEDIVAFLVGVLESNMGPKGRKFLPLLGSKEGILHLSMAYLNPGDKVATGLATVKVDQSNATGSFPGAPGGGGRGRGMGRF